MIYADNQQVSGLTGNAEFAASTHAKMSVHYIIIIVGLWYVLLPYASRILFSGLSLKHI